MNEIETKANKLIEWVAQQFYVMHSFKQKKNHTKQMDSRKRTLFGHQQTEKKTKQFQVAFYTLFGGWDKSVFNFDKKWH